MSGWRRAGRWTGAAAIVAGIVAVLGWGMVSRAAPARPRLVLVPLAPGAPAPRIDARDGVALEPAVIRGMRVLPVLVEEGRESAVARGAAGSPAESPALAHSRGFFDPYLDAFPAGARTSLAAADEGGYLIITAPELAAALEPLAAWKREMGFEVTVATTTATGTRNDQIQAYIRDLYEGSEVPPQYLILAGDVGQIPGWDYHQSVSDLPYALTDGDDFFPDLEVGRLSASNTDVMGTIVAKILGYEQDPARDGDRDWFARALMVAGNYSSSTPVAVARYCREELLALGYAQVDSVYYPPHWSTGPIMIRPVIDRGVSLVAYRGWAYGWQGWEPPRFTVAEIPSLANGWRLPAVMSFVCLNGNFVEPECFGEAWIRAGTAAEPKGAVAFIGNSEHWSHTRFNDAAAIGAFRAMREQGARRLGAILLAAKLGILEQFPDIVDFATHGEESVEFYFYIYSLLGDPSMEVWTAEPESLAVVHPDSLPLGSSLLEVTVARAAGGAPVAGARIGVSQAGAVLGSAFTDAGGRASVVAAFDDDTAPVKITVTGPGLLPYRGSAGVATGRPYLALDSLAVRDDGTGASRGNGDGMANPGETLELEPRLRNRGGGPATGVTAALVAIRGATVVAGSAAYPNIGAGEVAAPASPFAVQVSERAEDRLRIALRLGAAAGGETSVSGIELEVEAPAWRHESAALDGDGALAPGETAGLMVTIRNDGRVGAAVARAVLRSVTPGLAVVRDSVSSFPAIAPGASGAALVPFTVEAMSEAAVGQAAGFTLALTTPEGYSGETSFSVRVGRADHRAPLGPDGYGYYAYDNSDTDYPDAAPTYEWISCSTAYGGTGTRLDLGDNTTVTVALPFDFTFYGRTYRRLLVSDNGWASFDTTAAFDFYNWSMPNPYGTGAQMAPFWDNLDPTKGPEGGDPVGDGVYVLDDAARHRFVVEWSRLGNYVIQHPNRPDLDDLQTFELVLLDPAFHPTPTGDGIVRFQYKQVVNNDTERMYATVGIENEPETVGLEYSYANLYPDAAAPLSAGLAIEFTTVPPRYRPFRLAWFAATPSPEGVRLAWTPGDERPRGGWRVYRAAAGEPGYRLVRGGLLGPAARELVDREAAPLCTYRLGSLDPVGHETLLGPFEVAGEGAGAARALSLASAGPDPGAGSARLLVALPARARVRLSVYAASGRLVRRLIDGEVDAGVHAVDWDGRDGAGREAASAIYFGRLEAGGDERVVKLTLLR